MTTYPNAQIIRAKIIERNEFGGCGINRRVRGTVDTAHQWAGAVIGHNQVNACLHINFVVCQCANLIMRLALQR
jgi:hypothetical protein